MKRIELGFEGMRHVGQNRGTWIYPADDSPAWYKERPEVSLPKPWWAWCRHGLPIPHDPENEEGWAEPEVRITIHSDRTPPDALMLFNTWKSHDCGVFQQIEVAVGDLVTLRAEAHAWSSNDDNPRTSDGVGGGAFYALAGTDCLPPHADTFTFSLGIDSTGGTDPYADTVVWGRGAHIYNEYCVVPTVTRAALSTTVTVFLRQLNLWRKKHSDGYWRKVVAEIDEIPKPEQPPEPIGPIDPPPGLPREQYRRTYVLLPPEAPASLAQAVIAATWDKDRFTVGGSADDAGIGALYEKRVLALYPSRWPDDLAVFFAEHYPGTIYVPVVEGEVVATLVALSEWKESGSG